MHWPLDGAKLPRGIRKDVALKTAEPGAGIDRERPTVAAGHWGIVRAAAAGLVAGVVVAVMEVAAVVVNAPQRATLPDLWPAVACSLVFWGLAVAAACFLLHLLLVVGFRAVRRVRPSAHVSFGATLVVANLILLLGTRGVGYDFFGIGAYGHFAWMIRVALAAAWNVLVLVLWTRAIVRPRLARASGWGIRLAAAAVVASAAWTEYRSTSLDWDLRWSGPIAAGPGTRDMTELSDSSDRVPGRPATPRTQPLLLCARKPRGGKCAGSSKTCSIKN